MKNAQCISTDWARRGCRDYHGGGVTEGKETCLLECAQDFLVDPKFVKISL